MKTLQLNLRELLDCPTSELYEEARAARPDIRCPEIISVSAYSTGTRCKGDCQFCGWNRGVAPQPQERREFSPDILAERVEYAGSVNGVLELMDNAIAATPQMFERCEEVARVCDSVPWGVNPGICKSRVALARFRDAGAVFYANNMETSPRLFPQLVTTHGQEAKRESLARAREAGLAIATGVIIGVPGEKAEDYVAMADLLARIAPDVLRLNFFFPIEGLELAKQLTLPAAEEVLRVVCFFRACFPTTPMYLGAGRSLWLAGVRADAEALANGFYSETRFLNHGAVRTASM